MTARQKRIRRRNQSNSIMNTACGILVATVSIAMFSLLVFAAVMSFAGCGDPFVVCLFELK